MLNEIQKRNWEKEKLAALEGVRKADEACQAKLKANQDGAAAQGGAGMLNEAQRRDMEESSRNVLELFKKADEAYQAKLADRGKGKSGA